MGGGNRPRFSVMRAAILLLCVVSLGAEPVGQRGWACGFVFNAEGTSEAALSSADVDADGVVNSEDWDDDGDGLADPCDRCPCGLGAGAASDPDATLPPLCALVVDPVPLPWNEDWRWLLLVVVSLSLGVALFDATIRWPRKL